MPGWKGILSEVQAAGSTHDVIRRRYLSELSDKTGRNVIYYYSAWQEKTQFMKQGLTGFEVNDNDKNGLMAAIHGLDRSKGLDLVLHTPGGDAAATESIVEYLRSMFGHEVRAIVPHMAMSAGTMIALSCDEIVMGKHSSLGPIDPQTYGMSAHVVVEEFKRAKEEIKNDPSTIPVWQPIIAKYLPTLVGECEKAIAWSNDMVKSWLETGMLRDDADRDDKVKRILFQLGDHAMTKAHNRHIGAVRARETGIHVTDLEGDLALQEAVLATHHAFVATGGATNAIKIIENQAGVSHVVQMQVQLIAQQA